MPDLERCSVDLLCPGMTDLDAVIDAMIEASGVPLCSRRRFQYRSVAYCTWKSGAVTSIVSPRRAGEHQHWWTLRFRERGQPEEEVAPDGTLSWTPTRRATHVAILGAALWVREGRWWETPAEFGSRVQTVEGARAVLDETGEDWELQHVRPTLFRAQQSVGTALIQSGNDPRAEGQGWTVEIGPGPRDVGGTHVITHYDFRRIGYVLAAWVKARTVRD